MAAVQLLLLFRFRPDCNS